MSAPKLTLPIEIGKRYVRRDGRVVTAARNPANIDSVVCTTDDREISAAVYISTGRFHTCGVGVADLVADYVEPAQGHVHAASMALYAQDAAETAAPWMRWEFLDPAEARWHAVVHDHPSWNSAFQYRRKPKTIRIGAFDVPEPLRGLPAGGTTVWLACLHRTAPSAEDWQFTGRQEWLLNKGLLHTTREAAELHGKALLSLTEVPA